MTVPKLASSCHYLREPDSVIPQGSGLECVLVQGCAHDYSTSLVPLTFITCSNFDAGFTIGLLNTAMTRTIRVVGTGDSH